MIPVYACFFMGQYGYLTSYGVKRLCDRAQTAGIEADLYGYKEWERARLNIITKRGVGRKIALVGYSLGGTTTGYLQTILPVDLLLNIAESTLAENHPIIKANTKRSILYAGPDFLSSAGQHDGFTDVIRVDAIQVPIISHLSMDFVPEVVNGVLDELAKLKGS